MEQSGALISSLFTLRRIAYSIKEDRNDMATLEFKRLKRLDLRGHDKQDK